MSLVGGTTELFDPSITSYPFAIGPSGIVVGRFTPPSGGFRPFSWTEQGGVKDLTGLLGAGVDFEVHGVNVHGDIAGTTWSGGIRAFLHKSSGETVIIGPPDNGEAHGVAVNDNGQVVGYAVGGGQLYPFSWTAAGGFVALPQLSGSASSVAYAVNNAGHVAGYANLSTGNQVAFFWTPEGGVQQIANGAAMAMNDRDEVVGFGNGVAPGQFGSIAFIWSPADGLRSVGSIPGSGPSIAQGINASGVVAGYYFTRPGFVMRPFAGSLAAGLVDLGTLSATQGAASGISSDNLVVGTYRDAAGADHSMVWHVADNSTPPVIAPTVTGTLNSATGWYTSDVTLAWSVSSSTSNIVSKTGCDDITLSANQAEQTYTCTATSAGGTTTQSVRIRIDKTIPTVTGAVTSGTLGANGWYTTDVGITWAPSAPGPSGQVLSSDCATASLATDRPIYTFTCSVTTGAGVASTQGAVTVKRDATPPTVSYSSHPASYAVDQTVAITCSASDNLSGVASSSCADIAGDAFTFPVGVNSYSAIARDVAGNVSAPTSTSFTITVSSGSLSTLVRRFVSNAGVANSLCVKLQHGDYDPFRHELSAQAGKNISEDNAAILLRLVNAL
jgi:probable HAF family extracellular repeat protein